MDILINVLLIVFLCVALAIILVVVCSKKETDANEFCQEENDKIEIIERELCVLDSEKALEVKAEAFISLVCVTYVLIHTLVNEGNKYDDVMQSRHFSSNLTSNVVDKLLKMEGKYE